MTAARALTGRTVLGISAAIFAVVLGANLTLTYFAVSTFSGLVVDNGYVASQTFDRDRRAQEALGWTLALRHDGEAIRLDFTDPAGRAVRPATLTAIVGRPTSSRTDRVLDLERTPTGYAALAPLDAGLWLVQIDATAANGAAYHRRETLTAAGQ